MKTRSKTSAHTTATVCIAYKVGGYSNIPDIVINFSNSFSFAITKYTQLSGIVIIVYSNYIAYSDQIHISKDLYYIIFASVIVIDVKSSDVRGEQGVTSS